MVELPVITDDMRNGVEYDGVTEKFGVTYHGQPYILKLPAAKRRNGRIVYNLSCLTEYLASNFICSLGYPCQETLLCYYNNLTCCLVKDFIFGTPNRLHAFKNTKQSSADTVMDDKLYQYTYDSVLTLIQQHTKIPESFKGKVVSDFWNMYFCDAILGNRDRHEGNWGYLVTGRNYSFAPIYDNGGSLYPDVSPQLGGLYKDPKEFYRFRATRLPGAVFGKRMSDGHLGHSNYKETLDSFNDYYRMSEALNIFKRGKSADKMYTIMARLIQGVGVVSVLEQFYCNIVYLRYAYLFENRDFDEAYYSLQKKGLV